MNHSNTSIIKAINYETNEPKEITVTNGIISNISEIRLNGESLPYIGPGLVDLQVNGFGGVDFNTPPIQIEDVHSVTKQLWQYGVTTYYPTVITNSEEKMEATLRGISESCNFYHNVAVGVGGIHLEGPFISNEDGPRGAHNRAFVQAPNWSLFKRLQEAAGGRIKIVTLSPEWPGSIEFIQKCVAHGITVSIGHTSATAQQIKAAVDAGATMSTHLGNGAHVMLPRHPNYIWEQLAQDQLSTCIIADGFHLPDSVLKVMLKMKEHQAMLVSDSVSLAGMPPGKYQSHIGGEVVLTEEGKLHLADNMDLLAGSVQTLLQGVNHLLRSSLSTLPKAWNLASIRPSNFMKLPLTGIQIGAVADFVIFEKNEEVRILETYKKGHLVYQR